MKRLFVAVVCAVALFASAPAQAAPILVPDTDGLVGTIIFDLALVPAVYALSGTSTATIVDGAPISAGLIDVDTLGDADSAGYIDVIGAPDAYAFDFNFATSVFGAGTWSLLVTGTPVVANDPALLAFAGVNVGQFSLFDLVPFLDPQTQQQIGFVASYSLDFIAAQDAAAIPEPATLGLVAMGLAAAVRRRRQQKNA